MTARAALAATLLLAGSCGEQLVPLRLIASSPKDCDESGIIPTASYGILSVWVVVAQSAGAALYSQCIDNDAAKNVEELQRRLREKFRGFELSSEGEWNAWVLGRQKRCWSGETLIRLCGTASFTTPLSSGEILLPVHCESVAADAEQAKKIKEAIGRCRQGLPAHFVVN